MDCFVLWIRRKFRRSPVDDPKRYKNQTLIAGGSMGDVYVATDNNTRKEVAIKKFAYCGQDAARRESGLLLAMGHPNIVKVFAYFEPATTESWMIMEKMPTTLRAVLASRRLEHTDAKLFGFQLFRALNYLLPNDIIHGDVKRENILIDDRTKVAKLCDFGLWQTAGRVEQEICTFAYRAPELAFRWPDCRGAVDVWAAGCVMAEMLTGAKLFGFLSLSGLTAPVPLLHAIRTVLGNPTADDLIHIRPHGSDVAFPPIPQYQGTIGQLLIDVPPAAYNLIRNTVAYNPSKRLDPIAACAHEWFQSVRHLPQCRLFPSEVEGVSHDVTINFTVASNN